MEPAVSGLQLRHGQVDKRCMHFTLNQRQKAFLRAAFWLLLWFTLWPALVLAADHAPPEPDKRFAEWTVSADGQSLMQRSTGLVWQRCVAGTRWNGRDCAGQPLWVDLPQAQALARQQAQGDGLSWRLPLQRELLQLARLGSQPEQTLLPESSLGWVWSGSVPIGIRTVNPYSYDNIMRGVDGQNVAQMKFLHGWVVNTATGEARDDVLRRTPMFMLLVRAAR